MSTSVELDKRFTTEAGDSYGTISIRVVVLKTKTKDDKAEVDEAAEVVDDIDEEIDLITAKAKTPLASYLEKQAYGKMCVVFLLSGQRHHALDKAYIAKDLGFKQLYDRMIIVVDLDGLSNHAQAEIIQGSRQGLFETKVYFAILDRVAQTLKSYPPLKKLQLDAEQKVLDMASGNEALKNKLDRLIEGHHAMAHGDGPGSGPGNAGPNGGASPYFAGGVNDQDVVVMGQANMGTEAQLPVLVAEPPMVAIRLHPDEPKSVMVTARPSKEWANREDFRVQLANPVDGLSVKEECIAEGCRVTLKFSDEDYDDDEDYPEGELQVFARFKDRPETRMLKLPVVVLKKLEWKPPAPVELLEEPTRLRVRSRQPVRIILDGPAVYVKVEWNGKESLLRGTSAKWRFEARCLSLGTFPQIGTTSIVNGRFELILYPPHGILPGNELDFEVTAVGPDRELRATFKALIVSPVDPSTPSSPRKITATAPQTAGQRQPPYEPVLINEKDWDNPNLIRWGGGDWNTGDAGRYMEPTETRPLLLVINMDMGILKTYREGMVKGKGQLEAKTVGERMNHYVAHIGFHLYQMYWENRQKSEKPAPEETDRPQTDDELREEVNRVGKTLIRLMEVAAR